MKEPFAWKLFGLLCHSRKCCERTVRSHLDENIKEKDSGDSALPGRLTPDYLSKALWGLRLPSPWSL